MNILFRFTTCAHALALILMFGCASEQLQQPASVGADITTLAGATPAWTLANAKPISAESLRASSALPLPNPLNEMDAVALALDASPSMARQLSEVTALRAEAIDISTPMNPMVNFTSGVPLDSMGAVPIFAMLLVQIDELWKQPIRSEAARDSYQAALLSLGAGAVALAAETRVAWHEASLREGEILIAQYDQEITENLLSIARERFAVGESSADAVAKAQTEFVDAHNRVIKAREMLSTAQLSLMALVGRPESAINWHTGEQDRASTTALHSGMAQEKELLEHMANMRLDVRAALARSNAAQAKLELARRSRSNKVELGAGYDRDMQADDAIVFSANVELPIFNDGSARIAKAEAEFETARIEAERVRQTAITELRTALVRALASQDKRDTSAENVLTPSQKIFERAQASLAAGEGSRRDAIDAEHSLNHAKLEMTDLERERRSTRLALAKASGFLPAEVLP